MEQWDLRTVLKGKNPRWVQEPLEMHSANPSRPLLPLLLPGPFPALGQQHKALIVSYLLVFKGSFVAGPG